MIVEQTFQGAWLIYASVNHYLRSKTYLDYTKREAVLEFKEEFGISDEEASEYLLIDFCVIYTEPDDDRVFNHQGFNCQADDADHAEEQCLNAYPYASIVCVNYGFNNFSEE